MGSGGSVTTLSFTNEMLLILDNALQALPYKVAAPVIAEINKQIKEQQNEAECVKQPT